MVIMLTPTFWSSFRGILEVRSLLSLETSDLNFLGPELTSLKEMQRFRLLPGGVTQLLELVGVPLVLGFRRIGLGLMTRVSSSFDALRVSSRSLSFFLSSLFSLLTLFSWYFYTKLQA